MKITSSGGRSLRSSTARDGGGGDASPPRAKRLRSSVRANEEDVAPEGATSRVSTRSSRRRRISAVISSETSAADPTILVPTLLSLAPHAKESKSGGVSRRFYEKIGKNSGGDEDWEEEEDEAEELSADDDDDDGLANVGTPDSNSEAGDEAEEGEEDDDDEEEEEEEPEEQESSFEVQSEWIDSLMDEYWLARRNFEKIVAVDGKREFNDSLRHHPLVYRSHSGATPTRFELREQSLVKDQPLAFLRDGSSVVQKCSVIPIEKIESTPPMQYWTLTEVNIMADDEYTLSHIPFLGDTDDDAKFGDELQRTFPDGIHGTKPGCGEYINDWILFYAIKGLRGAHPELEMDAIFHTVHRQFPNKASVQGLAEMYPDLQIRFEPESIVRQDLTNADGELVANFTASRLLNSYEILICHKCFSYDCTMHNATVNEQYSTKRRYSRSSHGQHYHAFRDEPAYCSAHCYLAVAQQQHQQQQQQKSPTHRRAAENNASAKTANGYGYYIGNNIDTSASATTTTTRREQLNVDVLPGQSALHVAQDFTPHEEALFNILRSTGTSENFCRIVKVFNMCTLRKRTCRELYDYACRKTPLSPRLDLVQASPVKAARKKKIDSHRTFRAVKWASANGKVENNSMYRPCSHKGECKKEHGCRCVLVANLCTKYCPCNDDCQNRFPGCRCAPGNCRTRQCQCYFASWECDPDICKSCNCDKFDGCKEPICKNVSIQRGLQKRLLVAPSQVAGWGCFCQEDIEKNEFISEYCGEVISQAESERRGKIYDKIKCSYLFGLNDKQVVDATRVGNVIRFANHSCNPNCRAKVIVVNGDHKIGIFANRKIVRGEELFFDYAYNKSQQVAFLSKELPKNFYATN